jgi:predicted TIM-barrel enzyme
MAPSYTRTEVIGRLRRELAQGRPLYAGIVGTGISAKFAEVGGADLLCTYPLAKFRMAGHSSVAGYLPVCDAIATTFEMGEREILPTIREIPVGAGILGVDPTRDMNRVLDRVEEIGFSGVINAPSISCVDGRFRLGLEETGLGYDKEVELIRLARKRGLFTFPFCSTIPEVESMVDAGCDMVVVHLGNTVGGSIGSKSGITQDEAVSKVQAFCDVAKGMNPDVLVIFHGGPVVYPPDFEYVLCRTSDVDGYMGGSSGERFPVETSVTRVTQQYKSLRL